MNTLLFVFVFFNFHIQSCVKLIEEPSFIGQLAKWSIQWQWSFKSSGATTATVLWASVSFSCKKNCLCKDYTPAPPCVLLICVCVLVWEITQRVSRWFSAGGSVALPGSRAQPSGSNRNGQMTVSAKNDLKKQKTHSANLSSLLLLLHQGWSFHKQ